MLALPLIWLAAAAIAAVSSIFGHGEVTLVLAGAALIQLASLVGLGRRQERRKARTVAAELSPPPGEAETPLVLIVSNTRAEDRFGGPGPDIMYLLLLQKLVVIERRNARLRLPSHSSSGS